MSDNKRSIADIGPDGRTAPGFKRRKKGASYLVRYDDGSGVRGMRIPAAGLCGKHERELAVAVERAAAQQRPVGVRETFSRMLAALLYNWVGCDAVPEWTPGQAADLFLVFDDWECADDDDIVETPRFVLLDRLMQTAVVELATDGEK